jgi:hypothetical protein
MIPPPDLAECLRIGLRSKPDEWDKSVLHASDLRYGTEDGCARQLWLRLNGHPATPPHDGMLLMFQQGHNLQAWADDWIAAGLKEAYPEWSLEHWELDLTDYLPMSLAGRMDRAVVHHGSLTAIPIDYKTVRGKAVAWLDSDGAKPSNVIQVRGYCMGLEKYLDATELEHWTVPCGGLMYLDREGQNFARWFEVERNDREVIDAAVKLHEIAAQSAPPPVLAPKLTRRENKGPDSIYLADPWQCQWCDYRDVSCDGALPPAWRNLGIVGKEQDGNYRPTPGTPEGATDIVKALLSN